MPSLTRIYHFPISAQGEEVSDPIEISLGADGVADLSKLPQDVRDTLEQFGAPDELHQDRVFPKDGEQFLEGLLRMTNGYYRFRTTPERV